MVFTIRSASQLSAPRTALTHAGPTLAVILAAGKGKRMGSPLPKVLHPAAGRPLLSWVIAAARDVPCDRIVVIVGHGADEVRRSFAVERDLEWVLQPEQRGTGHAVAQVESVIGARGAAAGALG